MPHPTLRIRTPPPDEDEHDLEAAITDLVGRTAQKEIVVVPAHCILVMFGSGIVTLLMIPSVKAITEEAAGIQLLYFISVITAFFTFIISATAITHPERCMKKGRFRAGSDPIETSYWREKFRRLQNSSSQ
jgi:uncharacterized protein with PQ loop repeat